MPSDEEIKGGIIELLYESFETPVLAFFGRQDVIEDATEELREVDETDVEYQFSILEEEGYVNRDGTTVKLTGKGLEVIDQSHSTHLNDDLQREILEALQNQKRSDPVHPEVSLQELSEDIGTDLVAIHENVFLLDGKWEVELEHINQTPYATIQSKGRQRLNQ